MQHISCASYNSENGLKQIKVTEEICHKVVSCANS